MTEIGGRNDRIGGVFGIKKSIGGKNDRIKWKN